MENKSDALIIGSGFGGSVAASRLTDAGLSTTLLERGPWRDTEVVRDMGITERSSLPYGWKFYSSFARNLQLGRFGSITTNKHGLWELFLNRGISLGCSSGVGGGSHVYIGMNEKPRVAGFWNGRHEKLTDAVLDGHYDRVINAMGSKQLTGGEDLPNSASQTWKDSPVIDGDKGFNAAHHGVPFSDDITSNDRTDGGFMGARSGNKFTLDKVYLRAAIKKSLHLKPMSEVTGIYQLDKSQGARYRVEVFDHVGRCIRSYYADRVLMAAGTLNTMRLLFRSRDNNHGLSGMPALGNNFGTNSDCLALWNVNRPDKNFLQGLPCHGEIGLKGSTDDSGAPYLLQVGLVGVQHCKLPSFVVRYLQKNLLMVGFSADMANGTASWKRGKLRIKYNKKDNPSYAVIKNTFAEIRRRCKKSLYSLPFNFTVHPLGGATPGQNAETGVVDHRGEVYGHPGLFVVDGAALPGAPGVPPSMSIAAWSSHVSQHICKEHSKYNK